MKKSVLSLFMAFVLCLTLLPTSAFAAGGTSAATRNAAGSVAKVGDTEYGTLQEILDKMEPVEITLLDDVTEADLTVSAKTTINMAGFRITGSIKAYDSLTLTNGTVKGTVRVLGGTFIMTAPANADVAIDGDLSVKGISCAISGAKVGVKGVLYFGGTDMSISGTDKAVEWTAPAEVASQTFYGATTVDGKTFAKAEFDPTDRTYKVKGEIAKTLSNKQVGGSTEPTVELTIDPTFKTVTAGETATFTVT